jgi:trk system potassium uptake protein TrkA
VKDLPIPKKVVLIAIIREGSVIIPKGDTEVMAEDEILMLTDENSRDEILDIFG